MSITNLSELNYKDLVFNKPIKRDGYYYMNITKYIDIPIPVYIQTPKVNLQSNIININYVDLKIHNEEYKNDIQNIDDNLLTLLQANKTDWFEGKGLTDQFVNTGYLPTLNRNGYWRVSMINDNVDVYDETKNTIDIDELKIGDQLRCIVQLKGLWFTNTRWGVSWKLIQLKKTISKIKIDYMFPDDQDIDHDVIEPPPGMDD
jgi:hypothetical protein